MSTGDVRLATSLSAVVKAERGVCHYCGVRLQMPSPRNRPSALTATRDHIVPASVGGWNGPSNLVAACVRCNRRKGSRARPGHCDRCRAAWDAHLAEHGGRLVRGSKRWRYEMEGT